MLDISPDIIEYLFKTIIGILLSLMVWLIKDFKKSLDNLSKNIGEVNLSITTLALQDKHKEQSILELKDEVDTIKKEIRHLSTEQIIMDMKIKGKS